MAAISSESAATMADCLFCKMAQGEIGVKKLHEDEMVFSVRDINPRAPVHVMVIPKEHISSVREVRPEHGALLARMIMVADQVAQKEGVAERGYRLAFNEGEDSGQSVFHIHMHILGGSRLGPEA